MPRQKLQENFIINSKVVNKIPLTESNKIVEKGGDSYKCRAAYELPIWRLDQKNLNERIYGKNLAENLVKENKVTLGLTNHPKEDVDVNNVFCVERNPHIKEDILWVDAYLVGDKGQMVHEIIEAGGQVGLSSSAYGDVDTDGHVKEEGFEIERYADFVDAPSYEVFVNKENNLDSVDNQKTETFETLEKSSETVTNTSKHIKEDDTNKVDNKEKITMADKKLSIEEKNLIMGVKNLMKEANQAETPADKVAAYEQVLEYCDGEEFASEYIDEARQKIKEINTEVLSLAEKAKDQEKEVTSLKEEHETVKKDASTLKEELSEKTKDLEKVTEKYDISKDLLDDIKIRERKLREMYEVALAEKNGMVSASEYKELLIYSEELEEKVKELKESVLKYKKLARNAVVFEKDKKVAKKKNADDSEDDEEDEDEDEKDEGDGKAKDKKDSKEESIQEDDGNYRFVVNNIDVQEYYEDLYENNPSVEKIKDQILKCKTIFEAQKTYMNLKDLVEDIPSPYRSTMRKKIAKVEEKVTSRPSTFKVREGWD